MRQVEYMISGRFHLLYCSTIDWHEIYIISNGFAKEPESHYGAYISKSQPRNVCTNDNSSVAIDNVLKVCTIFVLDDDEVLTHVIAEGI